MTGVAINCQRHGRQPWRGHVLCERCRRRYQTDTPTRPGFAPEVCECGVQLRSTQLAGGSSRPMCPACYDAPPVY